MREKEVVKSSFFGLFKSVEKVTVVTSEELVAGAATLSRDRRTNEYRRCASCGKDTLIRRKEYEVALYDTGLDCGSLLAYVKMCSECGVIHYPQEEHEIQTSYIKKTETA